MKFTRKEFGKVHIEMMFVSGEHKHSDGPGGEGAAASLPLSGGDIFFDDEEKWSLDSFNSLDRINSKEANLLIVSTHQLGHALGLRHSRKSTALMAPGANPIGEVKLDIDDIQAIQAFYGAPGLPRIYDIEDFNIETGNRR